MRERERERGEGSVTRWRIKKLPNFYQKFAKNRPEKFFFKSHAYHNSPKISQIIGLHLWENKLSMPFKSCPIWSHWVASGYWDNCSCCCSKTTKECATATHFLTRPLLTKIDLFLLFLRYSNNCPKTIPRFAIFIDERFVNIVAPKYNLIPKHTNGPLRVR